MTGALPSMDLESIPGYREDLAAAIRRSEDLRTVCFLDAPLEICGVRVDPFTLHHFLLLDFARSPFLCGGTPEFEHVAQFLFIVRNRRHRGTRTRAAFMRKVAAIKYVPAVLAIEEYLDDALIDSRPKPTAKSAGVSRAGFAASIVHEFAYAYGWTADITLHQPLGALLQMQRLIDRDESLRRGVRPPPPFNQLVDRVKRSYARKAIELSKEGGPA